MSDTFRPIPRRILALFLADYESIKTFEELQQNAGQTLPKELEEVLFAAGNADAKSDQALAALERIAHSLEMLASGPLPQAPRSLDDAGAARLEHVSDEFVVQPLVDADTLPYGSMYSNTPHTIAVAAANVAYENASDNSTGLTYLMTFGGAHYLQAERGGVYEINWSMSMTTSAASDKLEGGIMVDGVAQTEGLAHGDVANANSDIEISGSAIIRVSALQQLSLYVMNHSAARDIAVDHLSFTAKLLDRRVVT